MRLICTLCTVWLLCLLCTSTDFTIITRTAFGSSSYVYYRHNKMGTIDIRHTISILHNGHVKKVQWIDTLCPLYTMYIVICTWVDIFTIGQMYKRRTMDMSIKCIYCATAYVYNVQFYISQDPSPHTHILS